MGETYRGSATQLTEQRTDRMILVISITMVLALVVGGFVVAANSYGDQDQNQIPVVDVQERALNYLDPDVIAQQQTLRKPDFVKETESGCWGPFNTEKGWIMWDGYYFPSELPLCITNDTIANWYIYALSYGGYEPYGGHINVYQKFEYKGTIYFEWADAGKGSFDCCTYNWWLATFYVTEDFCLESNQYPDASGLTGYIPDKEVCFSFDTYWTGCGHVSQHFTVIHSQSFRAFSKSFILTQKPNTLTPQLTISLQSLSGVISE